MADFPSLINKSATSPVLALDFDRYRLADEGHLMAPSPKEVHVKIHDEIIFLHLIWQTFEPLYGGSEERVALLNRVAPDFFLVVQRLLIRELYLGFSRITESPKKTGKKGNLTLDRLLDDPEVRKRPELGADLRSKIEQARTITKPFREHRNRTVAHLDFKTSLGFHPDPLPGISREVIREALATLALVWNTYNEEINHTRTYFGEVITRGGSDHLLVALEHSERWRKHEKVELHKKFGLPLDDEESTKT